MIAGDAEHCRVFWCSPQMLRIFGNALSIARIGNDPIFDDRLAPHETFLSFHGEFIDACMNDPVDSMGTYCMGWQL